MDSLDKLVAWANANTTAGHHRALTIDYRRHRWTARVVGNRGDLPTGEGRTAEEAATALLAILEPAPPPPPPSADVVEAVVAAYDATPTADLPPGLGEALERLAESTGRGQGPAAAE